MFVPGTVRTLRALLESGELAAPPLTAFAVTPELREWYSEADQEELEYVALTEAGRGSLRLLDEDPTAPRRRVVLSAEVPDEIVAVRPDLDRAVVRVSGAIPLRQVASAHVDGVDAEAAVRAAVGAVLEADLGGSDAQFLLDEAEGHELLWYATQEIGPLLELL